jgi:hypothetical protein
MVQATIAVGAFHRQDIQRPFHYADFRLVASRVGADSAGVNVGQVLTTGTEEDPLFDTDYCLGQGLSRIGHAYKMVCQTLGALGTDPWQLVQLTDEAGDGRGCGREVFHG